MPSSLTIGTATPRKLPRPFKYHWGEGNIVEEASVRVSLRSPSETSWEPSIQLLRYNTGEEEIRFCVYSGTRFTRGQFLTRKRELKALAREIRRNPGIREMLRELVG